MSHLDEGTLHALLDGELGSTELMEIEAHLDSCAACGSRLRSAREFLGEADRLVESVQFGRAPAAASPAAASQAAYKPQAASPPPRQRHQEAHPWDDASPVLLIPDNPESAPSMRRWPRMIGWAAVLYDSGERRLPRDHHDEQHGHQCRVGAATASHPGERRRRTVASPTETNRADMELRSLAEGDSAPSRSAASTPAAPPPVAVTAKPATPRKETSRDVANAAPTAKTRAAAAQVPEDVGDENEEVATQAAEQDAIRLQASRALDQLDRERRVGRAAAATAALDQTALSRRASPSVGVVAPAPPPPPPTLEQRAQVYLRIGLDEANRQFGGPVHVIEGMSPVSWALHPGAHRRAPTRHGRSCGSCTRTPRAG